MTCNQLKSSIQEWVGSEIECRSSVDDGLIATLPFLKPNGDFIEVGLEPLPGNQWRISDLGDTHATLFLAGVEMLEEYARAGEFDRIKKNFGLVEDQRELYVDVASDDMLARMFDFVHGIQSALALQLTIRPTTLARDFDSEVYRFFVEQRSDIGVPPESVNGKTGKWKFHFTLNHQHPETLVKAITATSRPAAMRLAKQSVFEIKDVEEVRPIEVVVIADDDGDRQRYWEPQVMNVFSGYQVPVLRFNTDRDELVTFASLHAL